MYSTIKIQGDLKKFRKEFERIMEETYDIAAYADLYNIKGPNAGEILHYVGDDSEVEIETDASISLILRILRQMTSANISYHSLDFDNGIFYTNLEGSHYQLTIMDPFIDLGYDNDFCTPDELKNDLECLLERKGGLIDLITDAEKNYKVFVDKYEHHEIGEFL